MDIKKDFIGSMVAEDFRTAVIFKAYGIDFCCKGGRTIEDACNGKKINVEELYSALEKLDDVGDTSINFKSLSLDQLIDYIEENHHRYVEEKTPILQSFLNKLSKVHGERHPELFEINNLFNESAKEFAAHLKKEELILFPFIKMMVSSKTTDTPFSPPHFGTVENPVDMMKHDHTIEGERFRKIAKLTNEYQPPADACNTYRVTFALLQEFENDLHKHIHLENNILFPQAILLENELTTKS